MNELGSRRFIFSSGERYVIVINKKTGVPLYYPNLYITTQVRNNGLSTSTMESTAKAIAIFYHYNFLNNIIIEENIRKGYCLSQCQIDGLRDFLNKNRHDKELRIISRQTVYVRMTIIANYITWLTYELVQLPKERCENIISQAVSMIRKKRPKIKKRNPGANINKSLRDDVIIKLMEVIKPESIANPFEMYVRERNQILVLLLYNLGIRCGELLNIKVEDIDFINNRIRIERRADEGNDPRKNQPLVKTFNRILPMKDDLASKLNSYVNFDRKKYTKEQNGYLFICYKSGPSRGKPLSITAYHKIISRLRSCDNDFLGITGHYFRHTWNYNFSKLMDSMPGKFTEKQQSRIRELNMGWALDSGTAAAYNSRFNQIKSEEASLQLQEFITRKGVVNDNKTK